MALAERVPHVSPTCPPRVPHLCPRRLCRSGPVVVIEACPAECLDLLLALNAGLPGLG